MIFAEAKKNRFDYEITQTLEVGISLLGGEVKSIRNKSVNLAPAWIKVDGGQLTLKNCHISPWKWGDQDIAPLRDRKLLAHKKEILNWESKVAEKKMTIVPLKMMAKRGKIKLEIGLGKGRKKFEKKQVLKERTQQREAAKVIKNF